MAYSAFRALTISHEAVHGLPVVKRRDSASAGIARNTGGEKTVSRPFPDLKAGLPEKQRPLSPLARRAALSLPVASIVAPSPLPTTAEELTDHQLCLQFKPKMEGGVFPLGTLSFLIPLLTGAVSKWVSTFHSGMESLSMDTKRGPWGLTFPIRKHLLTNLRVTGPFPKFRYVTEGKAGATRKGSIHFTT
ncbi:MAG: hypothetical protein ABR903_03475 [Thermodesulfovibrionales bacterium]